MKKKFIICYDYLLKNLKFLKVSHINDILTISKHINMAGMGREHS